MRKYLLPLAAVAVMAAGIGAAEAKGRLVVYCSMQPD